MKFEDNYAKNKKYCKDGNYSGDCGGAACSIYNLKYNTSKKITIVFQNGLNYNCHFVITRLTKKMKGNLLIYGKILKNT